MLLSRQLTCSYQGIFLAAIKTAYLQLSRHFPCCYQDSLLAAIKAFSLLLSGQLTCSYQGIFLAYLNTFLPLADRAPREEGGPAALHPPLPWYIIPSPSSSSRFSAFSLPDPIGFLRPRPCPLAPLRAAPTRAAACASRAVSTWCHPLACRVDRVDVVLASRATCNRLWAHSRAIGYGPIPVE